MTVFDTSNEDHKFKKSTKIYFNRKIGYRLEFYFTRIISRGVEFVYKITNITKSPQKNLKKLRQSFPSKNLKPVIVRLVFDHTLLP